MKRLDEQQIAIASVYAKALHDLADQRGVSPQVLADLEEVEQVLDADERLEGVFQSPLIDAEERGRVLDRIFRGKAHDLVVDTLQVMNRKGRLGLVRALVEAFRQENDRREKRVEVQVTTAVPLTESLRSRLVETLEARGARRTVRLVETVDQTIIGGLIVQADDRKYDHSVARDLTHVGEALADRASREIQSGKSYVSESDG